MKLREQLERSRQLDDQRKRAHLESERKNGASKKSSATAVISLSED